MLCRHSALAPQANSNHTSPRSTHICTQPVSRPEHIPNPNFDPIYRSNCPLTTITYQTYLLLHPESQPTSSRWRALTHSHIRSLSPNIDALATSEVTDTCLRGIANVLSAAGAQDPLDTLLTRASTLYRAQLRRIAELANRFSFILREGTMSTDFQPLFVESVRDFNPATMENLYASAHGTGSEGGNAGMGISRGRVLCTTEIGLQCLTQKGREGSKDINSQTIERRVVLKPRVVLENIVQMLDPAR